jgi:hypothetical protein
MRGSDRVPLAFDTFPVSENNNTTPGSRRRTNVRDLRPLAARRLAPKSGILAVASRWRVA